MCYICMLPQINLCAIYICSLQSTYVLYLYGPSNQPMCYMCIDTYLHWSRVTTARIPPNMIMAVIGDF